MVGCLSLDCLAWLSFLYHECLDFLNFSRKSIRFTIRWSSEDSNIVGPMDLLSSGVSLAGTDFATGRITFGDIVVAEITSFEKVWSTSEGGLGNKGVTFYKPVNLPRGFNSLGFLSQPNQTSSEGRILVAKRNDCTHKPTLASPVGYILVWSHTESNGKASGPGYFWLPTPPDGYKSLGYVVTTTADEPGTKDVICVRADLTDACKISDSIWDTNTPSSFKVWNLAPLMIGAESKGVPVGTFFCSADSGTNSTIPVACLKNASLSLSAMPSLVQLNTLMSNYGPTFFFHPDEKYFPSSISWLFSKGVLLHSKGESAPVLISVDGSNLPVGGTDDDEYWIDLPDDGTANEVKNGNLSTAKVYIHAKPMLGATFTDVATWIYHPFNGAATAKIDVIDMKLGKIGEHVSDWEHVTIRVNNFTGKLWEVFFSQHSGGVWLDATNLEYVEGGKFVVYSSKSGHASYPHPGLVLQGDHGVGIRNDTAKSKYFLDSSKNYEIISAEYLGSGDAPEEPAWLQYMRKWGPKVQYNSRDELEKVIQKVPSFLRSKLRSLANKFPDEVFGEEGPTGPKHKSSWMGDEKA